MGLFFDLKLQHTYGRCGKSTIIGGLLPPIRGENLQGLGKTALIAGELAPGPKRQQLIMEAA